MVICGEGGGPAKKFRRFSAEIPGDQGLGIARMDVASDTPRRHLDQGREVQVPEHDVPVVHRQVERLPEVVLTPRLVAGIIVELGQVQAGAGKYLLCTLGLAPFHRRHQVFLRQFEVPRFPGNCPENGPVRASSAFLASMRVCGAFRRWPALLVRSGHGRLHSHRHR